MYSKWDIKRKSAPISGTPHVLISGTSTYAYMQATMVYLLHTETDAKVMRMLKEILQIIDPRPTTLPRPRFRPTSQISNA